MHLSAYCVNTYLNKKVLEARRGILTCIAVVMTLFCLLARASVTLERVRVHPASKHTRLVLDLSDAAHYTYKELPHQVVITLLSSYPGRELKIPSAQGYFRGMRMRHLHHADQLQLTMNLASGARVYDLTLNSKRHCSHRLVLDIAPIHVDTFQKLDSRQVALLMDGERKVVMAVDPGHGGKDSGVQGQHGTLEKNITLAIGRDLAALINTQSGMKAILTRHGDDYVPLEKRYAIARLYKADLFISIHADSYEGEGARGASVWILSSRGQTKQAARLLAKQDNVDVIGGVALDDESENLASTLLSMQQGWTAKASMIVAKNVLQALAQLGSLHNRQVEHANFRVLHSPDVPSILVETAFINNVSEESKLCRQTYQKALAKAIMLGIRHYFKSMPPPGTWFAAQARQRFQKHLAVVHGGIKHRVLRGENLSSIAHHCGLSIRTLRRANSIHGDRILAGAILAILGKR